MRSYLIDEISGPDMKKIETYLEENAIRSGVDKIFWVRLPDDILSEEQHEHRDCGPHVFAVELGTDWVGMEFLIRSLKNMRCTCSGYGSPRQVQFILNFAGQMIESLEIRT